METQKQMEKLECKECGNAEKFEKIYHGFTYRSILINGDLHEIGEFDVGHKLEWELDKVVCSQCFNEIAAQHLLDE